MIKISTALIILGLHSLALADEDFDSVMVDGPGILSGDKGSFDLNSLQNKTPATPKQAVKNSSSKQDEFELFKQWQADKTANSASYQEFLEWRKFINYKNKQ